MNPGETADLFFPRSAIEPLPPLLTAADLAGQRLRLIADVHNCLEAFVPLVEEAVAEDRIVVQLGDLVDYGPDAPGCLRLMEALIRTRRGLMLCGNHDDKLWRHVSGRSMSRSSGLQPSLDQIQSHPDRWALEDLIRDLVPRLPLWLVIGRLILVHAGFLPGMLVEPEGRMPLLPKGREREALRNRALYGETDGRGVGHGGYPLRTYRWADQVPQGHVVVIGHDVRSRLTPQRVEGAGGGRVVLLDTGCGKSGLLSYLDVDLPEDPDAPIRFSPTLESLPRLAG